jgi:hypothetical protein
MSTNDFIRRAAAIAMLALLGGCASGPAFKAVEPAPADSAQLYIYRPMVLANSANVHKVTIDGKAETLSLPNASFQRVLLAPGSHTIAIRDFFNTMHCAPSPLTIELRAGQTAFVAEVVKITQGIGAQYVGCAVTLRPQEQALQDLAGLSSAQ